MLQFKRIGLLSAAVCLTVAGVSAQTTTTTGPGICPAPASSPLTAFSIERVLSVTSYSTTLTATLPTSVTNMLTGGQQIHERLIYNPTASTVTSTLFLVAGGSPALTPLTMNITGQTLATAVFTVNAIYTSTTPTPSALFVGTVSSYTPGPLAPTNIFGVSFQGAPVALSVGFTSATPPTINNVVELIAGQVVAYTATAAGTITYTAASTTPPGSGGTGPTIVLNVQGSGVLPTNPTTAPTVQVQNNQITIDASQTATATSGALTYTFKEANGLINFVPSGTSGIVTAYLSGRAGSSYTVTVTATTASGASSTYTFTIYYA